MGPLADGYRFGRADVGSSPAVPILYGLWRRSSGVEQLRPISVSCPNGAAGRWLPLIMGRSEVRILPSPQCKLRCINKYGGVAQLAEHYSISTLLPYKGRWRMVTGRRFESCRLHNGGTLYWVICQSGGRSPQAGESSLIPVRPLTARNNIEIVRFAHKVGGPLCSGLS
jgi:hypothetical protein